MSDLATALAATVGAVGSTVVVPFLNKVIGPAGEVFGAAMKARAERLVTKADAYLKEAGKEASQVEPKLLAAIGNGATWEAEDSMSDRWAALLANAADASANVSVEVSFTEVLKQLTPTQARLLELVYQKTDGGFVESPWAPRGISTTGFAEALGITQRQLAGNIDNLIRLRLCDGPPMPRGKVTSFTPHLAPVSEVTPTVFGYDFFTVCSPPPKCPS